MIPISGVTGSQVKEVKEMMSGQATYSQQRVSAATRQRYAEERKAAREFKLGRGREGRGGDGASDSVQTCHQQDTPMQ